MGITVGTRIELACRAAGLSQRALAQLTGIPQATLSRIMSGGRTAKMNEIVSIAWALGCTVAELTGSSRVRDRVQYAARATEQADMHTMREELLHYLELDAYLADQGISVNP